MQNSRFQLWLSASLLILTLLGFAGFSSWSRVILVQRLVEQTVDDNRTIGRSALDLLNQPIFRDYGLKEVRSLLQHTCDALTLPNKGYVCAVNSSGKLIAYPGRVLGKDHYINESSFTDFNGNEMEFASFFEKNFFEGFYQAPNSKRRDVIVSIAYPRLNIRLLVHQQEALLTERTDRKLRELWPVALAFALGLAAITYLSVSKLTNSYQKKLEDKQEDLQEALDRVVDKGEELQRKNEELEISNQEKDGLMGILAHDMRAPLNKIKGLIDITKLSGELSADQVLYINMMLGIIGESKALINDILEMASIESGEIQVKHEPIQVQEFIDHCLIPFEQSAGKKEILINKEVSKQPINIESDPIILRRILDNLLSNAIKYTPVGGNVSVLVAPESTGLHIAVADSGPGIKEEEKPLLFRKFQRLSAKPTAKESSTGLGLYIVKLLAEQVHAALWVDSIEGEGATFHLRVPFK